MLQPAEPSITKPSSTGFSLPNAQFVAAANLKAVYCFFSLHASRVSHVPTTEANAQQLRKIQKSGAQRAANGVGLRLDTLCAIVSPIQCM